MTSGSCPRCNYFVRSLLWQCVCVWVCGCMLGCEVSNCLNRRCIQLDSFLCVATSELDAHSRIDAGPQTCRCGLQCCCRTICAQLFAHVRGVRIASGLLSVLFRLCVSCVVFVVRVVCFVFVCRMLCLLCVVCFVCVCRMFVCACACTTCR